MPIFEYTCDSCGTPFEKLLLTSASAAAEQVACVRCGSSGVTRRLSTFSARGGDRSGPEARRSGSRGSSGGGCCSPGSCGCH